MTNNIFGVILAGGAGTRLWPLSRKLLPKQFLRLGKEDSLFEKTVSRITPLTGINNIVVVTNKLHAFGSGYHQLKKLRMLIEPEARNTAPAIGLACLYLLKICGNDPVAVVLPSDHMIADRKAFLKVLSVAVKEAEKGKIVTLGITPDSPETGYGYIKRGKPITVTSHKSQVTSHKPEVTGHRSQVVNGDFCGEVFSVDKFVEKPDFETARKYLENGGYYWNAGMFVFKASVMLEEFKKYLPAAYNLLEKINKEAFEGEKVNYDGLATLFSKMPAISIDYAVMEKSDRVCVIPSKFGWSDVGSWHYFYSALPKDGNGNVKLGDVLALDARDNLLYSGSRLVTAIGVKNLAIIETSDAILVSEINHSQKVKKIVDELKKQNRRELDEHITVERPWGSYTVLDDLPNYKVKKLKIYPGHKISYQYHNRRSEHWFVVKGSAEVTLDGKKMKIRKNRHVDIPLKARHMLFNPGPADLEIIEVQSGAYFGEDDIIRLNDFYGRK